MPAPLPLPLPPPKRRAGRLERLIILGGLLLVLQLIILSTFFLGREPGQPCTPGGAFSCRNRSFNAARCLSDDDGSAYCTMLCDRDTDCPERWHCEAARWTGGREESVCIRPDASSGVGSPRRTSSPGP